MSYDVEPCYCPQASEYEDLLNEVLTAVAVKKGGVNTALFKKIEQAIGRYQTAQEEYTNDNQCFDCNGCDCKE